MKGLIISLAALAFFRRPSGVERAFDFVTAAELTAFAGTAITGGGAAVQTTLVANGVLRLSGAATTDASGYQIQLTSMLMDLGPESVAMIEAYQKLSVIATEFELGYAVPDTSLIASAATDGIFLHKSKTTATMLLTVIRGGVADTRTVGDISTAGAYQQWGLQVRCDKNPRSASIVVFLNGQEVYVADGKSNAKFTNVPDDALLAPSYAFQSGSAVGTQTVDIDVLRVGFTRV